MANAADPSFGFGRADGRARRAAHRPLARWLRFNLVGLLGFAVQMAVLWLLVTWVGVRADAAVAVAVLTAVSHNFLWHERWTWPGLPRRGRLARWLSFHASTGLVSLAGNVVVTALVMGATRLPAVAANMVTVALLSIVNYWVSGRLVFGDSSAVHLLPSAVITAPAPRLNRVQPD